MSIKVSALEVRRGGQRILDDVSLSVDTGEMVGIIGPNGCGKSTLLQALWRSLPTESGAVLIDGTDIRSRSARELAQEIAVLMQDDTSDQRYTVREIVETARLPHRSLFGVDPDGEAHIDAALKTAGVAAHVERRIDTLSGGQRQRVFAARTLAQSAPVVLLDEPTNHLDLAAQLSLLDLFRHHGVTVIAALHDLNLAAAYCDRLVVLRHGRVVAHGRPEAVLTVEIVRSVFDVEAALTTNPLTGTCAIHIGPRHDRGRRP